MNKLLVCSLVLLFGSVNLLNAQQVYISKDLGAWTGLSIEKSFANDLSLKFEEEVRMYHNMTEFDQLNSTLELEYDINKSFDIGTEFRYSFDQTRDKDKRSNLRYAAYIQYKIEPLADFEITYRLKYQQEYENFQFPPTNKTIETDWRHRLKLQYEKVENHKIYLSAEYFKRHDLFREPFNHKYRLLLGDEFHFGPGDLDIALGYEQELDHSLPISLAFVKLNYCFGL